MSIRKEHEIIEIYDILFKRVIISKLNWGWDIKELILTLTSRSYVQSYILDNGFLDFLVSTFCDSHNYDYAAVSSTAVLNFNQYLSPEHVLRIANAIIDNNQIRDSWTARPNVKNILLFHKNVLKLDIVEKLKDNKILD
jgi:hypothetical protein